MRKKISFLILGVLLIGAVYLAATRHEGTIQKEKRDFAVEDTSSVDKLFLADKENNTILLERKNGYWALNSRYEARPDLVDLLLKTMARIRVKEPVPRTSQKQIIENLAVKSVKVEVYQHEKLTKVFYVGGPTQDSYGTYMILENSSAPFIMEIPGFRGYLSTRFSTAEIDWRSQAVFNYSFTQVARIRFENLKKPDQSFIIEQNQGQFSLFTLDSHRPIGSFDTLKVKEYIGNLKRKSFNKFIDDVPKEWQDSIKTSNPMYILTVQDTKGAEKTVKLYNKPGWGRIDDEGKPLSNDPDNFFMLLDSADFVYAQYYVFDPLLKELNFFIKK